MFRRVDSDPLVSERLRAHSDDARHQQEVLGALPPQPGARRRGRATLLQTAGARISCILSPQPLSQCHTKHQ